jgi:DNA-binding FadR family transcriptional regulator
VLDAAGNEFAASAMNLMNGLSRRFWYVHYKQAADLKLAARLHAAIARAIADADPDVAGRGSDALVDYIRAFARATIGS